MRLRLIYCSTFRLPQLATKHLGDGRFGLPWKHFEGVRYGSYMLKEDRLQSPNLRNPRSAASTLRRSFDRGRPISRICDLLEMPCKPENDPQGEWVSCPAVGGYSDVIITVSSLVCRLAFSAVLPLAVASPLWRR